MTTTLPATGTVLAHRERDVAGAWWHVDDQVSTFSPSRAAEELLDDPVKHRAARNHRRIIAREKRHRDKLDTRTESLGTIWLVVARQSRADAEHDRYVRSRRRRRQSWRRGCRSRRQARWRDRRRPSSCRRLLCQHATAMMLMLATGLCGVHVGCRTDLRGHLDVHRRDTRKRRHCLTRLFAHLISHRTGRRGQLNGKRNGPPGSIRRS